MVDSTRFAILVLLHSSSPREPEQIYGADRRFTSLINGGSPRFPCNYFHIPILPGSLTQKNKKNNVMASDCYWLLLASSFLLGEEAELKNRDVGGFLLVFG